MKLNAVCFWRAIVGKKGFSAWYHRNFNRHYSLPMRLILCCFCLLIFVRASAEQKHSTALYRKFFPQKNCSEKAFDLAWKGYENLKRQGVITAPDYLSILDYTLPSNQKRFFVLRLKDSTVAVSSIASHGVGSDPDSTTIPYVFGNYNGSRMSSLGFFLTGETYRNFRPLDNVGLCLFGLDIGYNDSAAVREIVVHYGASEYKGNVYVTDSGAGRSYGCPALPLSTNRKVIDLIQGGSVLFVYSNRDHNYIQKSTVLNRPLALPIHQLGPPPNNCRCQISGNR